ncbi:M14 family metallopeptidase [Mycetohabitans rhizoxinica]|uniref:Peptidase M14 domain-containing protein n=1 Tax=Mycetohabitans rhizoxinica TaxID=412963 RepID=A0ABZ2Q0T8_9BURK
MSVHISSQFDSGAIDVVSCERADDIRLRLRADTQAAFAQWFYFSLSGAKDVDCTMTFENASHSAFPNGWHGYQAVASHDGIDWFRVPTTYDGQVLRICHRPARDRIYYAYFEPYPYARHAQWVDTLVQQPGVRLTELTRTVQARALDLLTVGEPAPHKRNIWIIARQHPGETMAQWFVEGLLKRLCGLGDWRGDPLGRIVLEHAVFHVVPNMNPDGSALGNLRTNAAGADLNREWLQPDPRRSPEVLAVRDAIHASGCDMFFDIHGDEALPYVFVAGSEMLPDFSDAQRRMQDEFIGHFKRASAHFQDEHGYKPGRYQQDALKLASKYVGYAFKCLSLTLEMPFKDDANLPDPRVGWNGARSASLGAAMLQAIGWQLDAI